MTGDPTWYGDEAPTVEVRVFRDGELVHRELCESVEQAELVTEAWADVEGVRCEIGDLAGPAGDLADDVDLGVDDGYPAGPDQED